MVVLHAKITGLVNQDLPRKDITACVEAGQVQDAKMVGLKNGLNERSSYETTQAVPHLKGGTICENINLKKSISAVILALPLSTKPSQAHQAQGLHFRWTVDLSCKRDSSTVQSSFSLQSN